MGQQAGVLAHTELLVSAVIPTRPGGGPLLEKTIASIMGQSYEMLEAIVVDEGLERSAQRNLGARMAAGDVIWTTDDDMVFDPLLVQQAVKKIKEGYHAVIVRVTVPGTGRWLAETRKRELSCYVGSWANESACMFTREAYFAVGGFDEKLDAFEDMDMQRKLDRAGYRTARIPANAYHLGEPSALKDIIGKYVYYGQRKNVVAFAADNPGQRLWSLLPFRLVYLRHLRQFGLYFFPFLLYHYVKYASALIGFLASK